MFRSAPCNFERIKRLHAFEYKQRGQKRPLKVKGAGTERISEKYLTTIVFLYTRSASCEQLLKTRVYIMSVTHYKVYEKYITE